MRGIGIALAFGMLLVLAAIDGHAESRRPRVTTRGAQEVLARMGYRPGPIDGVSGPLTERALRGFQLAEELVATGRLDRETRDRLRDLVAFVQSTPEGLDARDALEATTDLLDQADVEGDDAPVDEVAASEAAGTDRDGLDAVDILAAMHSARARAALGIVLHGS